MSVDEVPEVENQNGVIQISYDSDGVLALPEGTEYSREDGEFERTSSNEILALEEGTSVYLDEGAQFEAYGLLEFLKELSDVSDDTSIFDPEKTEVYDPGKTGNSSSTPVYPGKPDGSGETSVFDPSDYEIGDPTEYTKMMKENADIILLELADRDVTGEEAVETLDSLFENMNETYDRFVYNEESSQPQTGKEKPGDESGPTIEGEKKAVKDAEEKLDQRDAEKHLSKVEKALEEESEGSDDERKLEDYVDAEELLRDDEQSEIDDFDSVEEELEEGQSEISDF